MIGKGSDGAAASAKKKDAGKTRKLETLDLGWPRTPQHATGSLATPFNQEAGARNFQTRRARFESLSACARSEMSRMEPSPRRTAFLMPSIQNLSSLRATRETT